MRIEDALRIYLLSDSALRGMIGNRIYFKKVPLSPNGSNYPAVVYIKVSDVKSTTHDGLDSSGEPVFQYSAQAKRQEQARSIYDRIQELLTDYSGILSGLKVSGVTLLNEMSDNITTSDNSLDIYTEDGEFQVFYERMN